MGMLQGILQRATKIDGQVWTLNSTIGEGMLQGILKRTTKTDREVVEYCKEFYGEPQKMTDKFEHEIEL